MHGSQSTHLPHEHHEQRSLRFVAQAMVQMVGQRARQTAEDTADQGGAHKLHHHLFWSGDHRFVQIDKSSLARTTIHTYATCMCTWIWPNMYPGSFDAGPPSIMELAAQKTLQATGNKQAAERVAQLFQDVFFAEMLRRNITLLVGAFLALLECSPCRPS